MPVIYDEMPATKPAPKKRVNKTYRKKLTKKQLKKRKDQALIILFISSSRSWNYFRLQPGY